MSRIFDCFMLHNELDVLECRLEELSSIVDRFVVVESGENHLGNPKRSIFLESRDRFARWQNQIEFVWVPNLLSKDPRDREHEQREWIRQGLTDSKVESDDFVIQSDLDEIVSEAAVRRFQMTSCTTPMSFAQTQHFFAVDWQYPKQCDLRPVVAQYKSIESFWAMRLVSVNAPTIQDGGWHFSWLGGRDLNLMKLAAIYEGPEISSYARPMIDDLRNWREGIHVDGVKMRPIEVDEHFPAYVRERRCPKNWFRPR